MKVLRLLWIVAVVASALCSCTKEGREGKSRLEAFWDRNSTPSGEGSARENVYPDTAIFVTAVSFPEGYDWQRDSSLGNVRGASVLLLRDGRTMLSVPAGPGCMASADPDMHHLVDGHLYTEHAGASMTTIGRDGEELFSYEGRELLCGLLVEGDDVYTLGQDRSGDGFSLRCNGEVLYRSDRGSIAVHISDNMDYPTGALYRDGGHMYFCFFREMPAGSGDKAWYIVEDCVEDRIFVEDNDSYDIRVRDGNITMTRIIRYAAKTYKYNSSEGWAYVATYPDGSVAAYTSGASLYRTYSHPHYFFSFRNGFLFGKQMYLALTPAEKGLPPYIWKDGEKTELEINGFVTAIEVSAVPGDGS